MHPINSEPTDLAGTARAGRNGYEASAGLKRMHMG